MQVLKFLHSSMDAYVLRYMGILASFTTLIPAVYYESQQVTNPTEYFLSALHLLLSLGMSIKDLVLARKSMDAMRAHGERIENLLQVFDNSTNNQEGHVTTIADDKKEILRLENLTINIPSNNELEDKILIQNVSLQIKRGESLLIEGPNGCGKTTLLRVIRGLWPHFSGTVQVSGKNTFYLPQRQYIIPGISLRQQLIYPRYQVDDEQRPSDKEILKMCRLVGLEKLVYDKNMLDSIDRCDTLSGGEQQKIAIARLLLAQPILAFVDECTSECTKEFEKWFFQYAQQQGITLVTISHNPLIRTYHMYTLVLPNGTLSQNT